MTTSSILPAGSLLRLKSLEDSIAYKYSQDRIDQGLDQEGNDIEDPSMSQYALDEQDHKANFQWLLKLLSKLEETAPEEEEEEEQDENGNSVAVKEETAEEKAYRLEHELLTERVSSCMAHFCGRAAAGAMTRTWTFKTQPPKSLQIHDPSFTAGDVGFKTFGSAYLLSKHIAHGDIPQLEPFTSATTTAATNSGLPLPRILELGSGTGLTGFTAALYSNPQGPKVVLSDYHPNVLSTLKYTRELNHLEDRCDIQLLDWRDALRRRKLRWNAWQSDQPESSSSQMEDAKDKKKERSTEYDNVDPTSQPADAAQTNPEQDSIEETPEQDRYDLILGAEVVYDHGHAELVAHVVDEYLKKDLIKPVHSSDDSSSVSSLPLSRRRPAFHIMFPIRKTHTDVIADFDFWMEKMGLVDCREAKEWGREDGETKFMYHWREYVRKEHL
ncbi:hypothetical protein EMPS_11475 [Entomortierella parvispora]|uniref:Uncharacterized protein n=1 Tax=Entomortierella parvispora TaxID=205924 RepID=A0A9P3HM74_9FUNG|nr:hypothetical protein EMPS_11475 [Entomortierella parvispora]